MNTAAVVSFIAAWFAGALIVGLVIGRMIRNRDIQRPRSEDPTRASDTRGERAPSRRKGTTNRSLRERFRSFR